METAVTYYPFFVAKTFMAKSNTRASLSDHPPTLLSISSTAGARLCLRNMTAGDKMGRAFQAHSYSHQISQPPFYEHSSGFDFARRFETIITLIPPQSQFCDSHQSLDRIAHFMWPVSKCNNPSHICHSSTIETWLRSIVRTSWILLKILFSFLLWIKSSAHDNCWGDFSIQLPFLYVLGRPQYNLIPIGMNYFLSRRETFDDKKEQNLALTHNLTSQHYNRLEAIVPVEKCIFCIQY